MIAAGMTSAEFVTTINSESYGRIVDAVDISSDSTGVQIETTLNSNFNKSESYVGLRGAAYIAKINANINEIDASLIAPTDIILTWEQDYCKIDFTDNSGAKHEIWERQTWLNTTGNVVENSVLRATLNEGVETLNLKTWQNSTLDFRIRAAMGASKSVFTDDETINTPNFVFRTDQSILTPVVVNRMLSWIGGIEMEGTNNIDWGDGSDNYYTYEDEDVINHEYESEGVYWITITGDPIHHFEFHGQPLAGTDVTYWQLNKTFFCHFWDNGFIGSIENWHPGYGLEGLHLEQNSLTESCIDWLLSGDYALFWDCHLSNHYINASNAGDLKTKLPNLAHFNLKVIGDISAFVFPKNDAYSSWMFKLTVSNSIGDISNLFGSTYDHLHTVNIINSNITGDTSEWFVASGYPAGTSIELYGNKLTKLPRGNFYLFAIYNCATNLCNTAEIDALLADILASVTANAPEYNCVYTLNGAGMGIPSATGLTAKTNIETKYTDAGKTATIYVNS